jgi:osmotically-inducible protein OsmY
MTLSNKYDTDNEPIFTSETELATAVTNALMADKRTKDEVIEVINERGLITLTGRVESRKSLEAAQEIAATQPGVISVVNSLKVAS